MIRSFPVKCDDNAAEADSFRGGSISNDAAASLEMKVNSVNETLLISSPSSHPTRSLLIKEHCGKLTYPV
jgi:hypothetical protein